MGKNGHSTTSTVATIPHFCFDLIQVTRTNSSCPPIGIYPEELCDMPSADLSPGDVLVLYIDSVTGEEFGVHRLSAVVRRGSSQSAEELMIDIFNSIRFLPRRRFSL